jgi:TusA-related sulfurtransferase
METLDLRGIPCPRNTAKALMFLEVQDTNSISLIIIDDGEPMQNFEESLELETSYQIQKKERNADAWDLYILKKD